MATKAILDAWTICFVSIILNYVASTRINTVCDNMHHKTVVFYLTKAFPLSVYVPFDVRRMNDAIAIQLSVADRARNPSLDNNVAWSATVRQLECPDKAFIASYNKLLGNMNGAR